MFRGYLVALSVQTVGVGTSFGLLEIAIRGFEPTTAAAMRMATAGLILIGVVLAMHGVRPGLGELRGAARIGAVQGLANVALPYLLIAWGQTRIDSSVAAIAVSSLPLFTTLLAMRYMRSEQARGLRLVGLVLGLVGVAIVTGVAPSGGWYGVVGTLAVVGSAVLWAASGLYAQLSMRMLSVPVFSAATVGFAGLYLLPIGILQAPDGFPGWGPVAALATLGLTAPLIQLNIYRMLHLFGALRTMLHAYLTPPVALFVGVLFLDESLRISAVAGLALILLGVTLASRRSANARVDREVEAVDVPRPHLH